MRSSGMTWGQIYWRVRGMLEVMYCTASNVSFQWAYLNWCPSSALRKEAGADSKATQPFDASVGDSLPKYQSHQPPAGLLESEVADLLVARCEYSLLPAPEVYGHNTAREESKGFEQAELKSPAVFGDHFVAHGTGSKRYRFLPGLGNFRGNGLMERQKLLLSRGEVPGFIAHSSKAFDRMLLIPKDTKPRAKKSSSLKAAGMTWPFFVKEQYYWSTHWLSLRSEEPQYKAPTELTANTKFLVVRAL